MKKNVILLFAGVLSDTFSARAQDVINTIAGDGTAAFGGDSGPASASKLNTPFAVAVNAAGDVFIADNGNNRIRKIDHATGNISTIAGTGTATYSGDGGPATAADIQGPRSIIVDDTGNIYFSDYANNRIRKIDTNGIIHLFAGVGGAPAFGGDEGPATAAHLGFAWGIARDDSGNFYLADQMNNRIRKIDRNGIIHTIAGTGSAAFSGDSGLAVNAKIQFPTGVAVDRHGNIIVADNGNNRVRRIDTAGVITTLAGSAHYGYYGDDSASVNAKLYYPREVCVDAANNIYITDLNNYRIRVIDTAGIIHTAVGNGTEGFAGDGLLATDAEIDQATGVAVDHNGDIFIADNNNNRLRKVSKPFPFGVVDIAGQSAGDILVFPNPSIGSIVLTIRSGISEKVAVMVTDATGKIVETITVTTNRATGVNLNAPPGTYFFTTNSGGHRISAKAIIKK